MQVGDTVGFGPTAGSCGDCELCRKGIEQSCGKMEEVYNPKWGGYATTVTVHDKFAFKIPDGMPLHATAPLLCAGVTTYAPLTRNVKRGDKVGIVGIGGLGHLALQFAAAMGCEVWALSRTPEKEPDALKLGASRFLLISDKDGLKAQDKSFDFLMCCSSDHFDLDTFMALLKPRASFCLVGLPAVEPPLQVRACVVVPGCELWEHVRTLLVAEILLGLQWLALAEQFFAASPPPAVQPLLSGGHGVQHGRQPRGRRGGHQVHAGLRSGAQDLARGTGDRFYRRESGLRGHAEEQHALPHSPQDRRLRRAARGGRRLGWT